MKQMLTLEEQMLTLDEKYHNCLDEFVNDNCLEHCFKHFEEIDRNMILNFAQSYKQLEH